MTKLGAPSNAFRNFSEPRGELQESARVASDSREHATRTMLKENVCVIPAPDALRRQIAASLDAIDHTESKRIPHRIVNRPRLWVAIVSLTRCLHGAYYFSILRDALFDKGRSSTAR